MSGSERRRVLVIDEDAIACQRISRVLADDGFDVAHCPTLQAAAAHLASTPVDLVVLDYCVCDRQASPSPDRLEPADRVVILAAQLDHLETLERLQAMARTIADRFCVTEAYPAPITERESEALRDLVGGLSNKEIAAKHGTSESAVKGSVQRLFRKMGARTRSQLVRIALEQGLTRK